MRANNPNINDMLQEPKEKESSKTFVMNKLKLSKGLKEGTHINYTRKDGVERSFKIKNILELKDKFVVIQTDNMEFKKLLIENITKIEEQEGKNVKVQK